MQTPSKLELALADAGGPAAASAWAARLRDLLRPELERGRRELEEPRTGRERPIVLAVAPGETAVVLVAPLPPELRADPGVVSERGADLASAATASLCDSGELGPPAHAGELALRLGSHDGHLALAYPARDPADSADYAREALADAIAGIDRLRASVHLVPAHALDPQDLRPPIGPTHPLRVAEAVARLGGSPLEEESVDALEDRLLDLLEPEGSGIRAHDEPDPRRRGIRRILQRLDGKGKWGGYHTSFDHLARGFAGNERALASDLGEQLLAAGLLVEKPSVGQRHVSLNPRRAGEIRRLIDDGELPSGL